MNDKNQLSIEQKENVAILQIAGEIVFENSHELKENTKNRLATNEVKNLIINLDSVSYLDSSGVGFLISIFKFMRENNGKLVIANLNQKIKRVCEMTKLDQIIDIYENIEQAVTAFD